MHLFVTVYFLSFILVRHAIEIGLLLFAVLGIACLLVPGMRKNALVTIGGWNRQDSWMCLGFASIFIFKILSALWSASPELAIKNALWHAHFLAWPLAFIALAYCKPKLADAMSALSIGLVFVGTWAVVALFIGKQTYHTLYFTINSGVLAELVLVCGAVLWVCVLQTTQCQKKWRTVLYIAGMFGAFAVLYTTHRRTEWLGFFVVIFTASAWRYRKTCTPLRAVLGLLLVVLAVTAFFYLRHERLMTAYHELLQYFVVLGKDHSALATSVGARLEMYRLGWAAFVDHPLFGMGAGVRPYLLQAYGGLGEVQMPHRHFHSEFLQVLVEGGLVWALTLSTAIAYWFKHAVKCTLENAPQLAMLAFYVVFSFMLAGSVSAALIYGPANGTLVMFTALIWCCIRQHPLLTHTKPRTK